MTASHLRPVPAQEALLTKTGLAELWNCSTDTIERMQAQGLPSVRWSKKFLRFRLSECVAWLDEQQDKVA